MEEETIVNQTWKEPDVRGNISEDLVFSKVQQMCLHNPEAVIFVGTDSHTMAKWYQYITVLGVYFPRRGGNYFFTFDVEERRAYKGAQKMRMWSEASKSIEVADRLRLETGIKAEIHLDISPSHKKEFTSQLADQLKGYVIGAGYEVKTKPDSWAASAIADKHARSKGRRVRNWMASQ